MCAVFYNTFVLHGYWIPSLVKLWKRSAYFFELPLLCTPPKTSMEPDNTSLEKKKHLPTTYFWLPPYFSEVYWGVPPVFFARGVAQLQSDKDVHELPAADLVAGCDGVNSATGRASLARRDGTFVGKELNIIDYRFAFWDAVLFRGCYMITARSKWQVIYIYIHDICMFILYVYIQMKSVYHCDRVEFMDVQKQNHSSSGCMTCPSVYPLVARSSAQALLLHVLALRPDSGDQGAVLTEHIRCSKSSPSTICQVFYIISINWLAGFLPSTVFFSIKGECKWWLKKQELMIWNHWDKDVWMILTVVERFQTPTSFYSNRKKGTGSKKEALCHQFFCLMDCLHLLEEWNEWNCVLWNIGSVNVLYVFNANPEPCSDRNTILPLNPSLASPQSVLCHVFGPFLAMITASCRSHKRSCLEVSKFSDFQSNLATEKCKMESLWERKDILQFISSVYF